MIARDRTIPTLQIELLPFIPSRTKHPSGSIKVSIINGFIGFKCLPWLAKPSRKIWYTSAGLYTLGVILPGCLDLGVVFVTYQLKGAVWLRPGWLSCMAGGRAALPKCPLTLPTPIPWGPSRDRPERRGLKKRAPSPTLPPSTHPSIAANLVMAGWQEDTTPVCDWWWLFWVIVLARVREGERKEENVGEHFLKYISFIKGLAYLK